MIRRRDYDGFVLRHSIENCFYYSDVSFQGLAAISEMDYEIE